MGSVYRVSHRGWNTDLAVKTPRPQFMEDEIRRARFVEEANVWVNLGVHPNVVTCYFVREVRGLPRVFAEYVDGGDLGSWITAGVRRSWTELIGLAIDVGDGLAYAHDRGVVHRDVKPGNILLSRDGVAKASDFGLARVLGFAGDSPAGGVGTPEYMAPEQWRKDGDVGPWSDVYSLGVVIYEMGCGRRPFERDDEPWPYHGLRAKHLSAAASPLEALRADAPARLARLVGQCLAKAPQDRPASMRDVTAALRETYTELSGKSYPEPIENAVSLRSDALNNRALSLRELGRHDESQMAWDEALRLDPEHPESTFNNGMLRWVSGDLTDDRLRERVAAAASKHGRPSILRWLDLARGAIRSPPSPEAQVPADGADAGDALSQATLQTAIGSFGEALELLDRADTVSASETGRRLRCLALWGLGRRDEATASWAALHPGNAPPPIDHVAAQLAGLPGGETLWSAETVEAARLAADGRFLIRARSRSIERIDIDTKMAQEIVRPPFGQATERELAWQRMAIDASARLVFSCAGDPQTRLHCYDLTTQTVSAELPVSVEAHHVTHLHPHPDGTSLALLIGPDIGLWDVASGRYLPVFVGHRDRVRRVCFRPGRDEFISVGDDGSVRIWGRDGFPRGVRQLEGGLYAVATNADGTLLLTGGQDRLVRLWDLQGSSMELVRTWSGHEAAVTALTFVPGRPWMLSGDNLGTLRQWDLNGPQCRRTIAGVVDRVQDLQVADGASRALVRGVHGAAVVSLSRSFLEPPLQVSRVRSGRLMLSMQERFSALLHRSDEETKAGRLSTAYAILREAQNLAGYDKAREILDRLQRLAPQAQRAPLRGAFEVMATRHHRAAVIALLDRRSLHQIVSAGKDGAVLLTDCDSGKRLASFEGHTQPIRCMALSVDDSLALTGGEDDSCRLWRLDEPRRCLALFRKIGHNVLATSISSGARYGYSVSEDGVIARLDLDIGEVDDRVTLAGGAIAAAVSRSNEEWLLAVQGGGLLHWRAGERPVAFEGSCEPLSSLAVSPTGMQLAAATTEGAVIIFDVQKQREVKRLQPWGRAPGAVTTLTFPIDSVLLVGNTAGQVMLFGVVDGAHLGELTGASGLSSASSSENGWLLTCGHVDGTIRRWQLDWNLTF
jgi:serine/threonine protein kinase/WD40 repeat protein